MLRMHTQGGDPPLVESQAKLYILPIFHWISSKLLRTCESYLVGQMIRLVDAPAGKS